MPGDYNPVVAGGGVNSDANIASFDLEIASNRQTTHGCGGGGRRSGGGRPVIMWFFVASVVIAGYCIYTGTLDLPKGLIGAPMDESEADSPSNDDFAGLADDDWDENSVSMPPNESRAQDAENDIDGEEEIEQEQNTLQQEMIYEGSQEMVVVVVEEEEAVVEPQQDNQHQPADNAPKIVFCYGDSLTFGLVPNEGPHPYGPFLESELNNLYSSGHPPTTVVQTLGFPGMTALTMLELVEKEQGTCFIVENVPNLSVMIILTGTNDLGQSVMAHEQLDPGAIGSDGIAKTILEHITNLHKATLECAKREGNMDMRILSLGIPGSEFQKNHPAAASIVVEINKGLKEFASSYNMQSPHGKIVYCDFPFEYDDSKSKWGPDGLHLSRGGYEELGKALAPQVKTILDMMYND